jgi:hypothetical protein
MKKGKAVGVYGIPAEFLKIMGEQVHKHFSAHFKFYKCTLVTYNYTLCVRNTVILGIYLQSYS